MTGLASIYAEDATVQSPLRSAFYGPGKGIARGRNEVLQFLQESVKRGPVQSRDIGRDIFGTARP